MTSHLSSLALPDSPERDWAWMKRKDWDALEYLMHCPILRPEQAKALYFYLEYDAGNMEMPPNYEGNLEAARSVLRRLSGSSRGEE